MSDNKATEAKPAAEDQAKAEKARDIMSKLLQGMGPADKEPEKPSEAPEVRQPDPTPAKVDEKAETPTEKPAEPEKKPVKKTKVPDKIIPASELLGEPNEDAVTKAATAAATAAVKAMAPKEEKAKEEQVELPKDIQKQLDVFKELESREEYKGITKQVVDFKKKGGIEDQYIRQWKKANPGKPYDPEDDDHTEFYEENDPTTKFESLADDLEAAKETLIERRVEQRVESRLKPKIDEQRDEARRKELEPQIAQTRDSAIFSAVEAISPDLAKTLREKGGEAVGDEDPMAFQVVEDVVPKYLPVIEEAARLFSGVSAVAKSGPSQEQSRVIESLNELNDYISAQDQSVRVRALQTNRGTVYQRFVPFSEFHQLPPEQQAKSWTVTGDDVIAWIQAKQNNEIKARYDRLTAAASKRFGGKPGQEAAKLNGHQAQAKTQSTAASSPSPSIGSGAPAPVPAGGESKKAETGYDIAWRFLRGE